MTTNDDRSGSQFATARRRRWALWILAPATAGAVIGGALAARETPLYKSETLIRVMPQRIPESLGPSIVSTEISDRVQMIRETILNRTRLERLMKEFDLYEEERRRMVLEEIFETMREKIETNVEVDERSDAVAIRVSFIGTEPHTVMRVTERIATLFINENAQDRAVLADVSAQFLEEQLVDMRRRLVDLNKRLRLAKEKQQPEAETLAIENEVLRTTFKDVSAKVEESRVAADLERRQLGERFALLEPASLPEWPIAPDWRRYLGIGAGAGAAFGLLLLLAAPTRSSRHRRQALDAEAPATAN